MTHLDAIIGPLLLRNNCVIIPSFGGFVANYVAAKVDVQNGLIQPPSKALSFNKSLTTNDGLLIQALSKEENLSFDQAQELVHTEVAQMKDALQAGNRVHLHNVGYLYLNEAGKVAFEQERFFNLLLASYGLSNVQFIGKEKEKVVPEVTEKTAPILVFEPQKITQEEPNKKETKTEEAEQVLQQNKQRNLVRRLSKYAAVAAIIPIAFYSFWIPVKTDVLNSGIIFKEDFNPFYKERVTNYKYAAVEADINPVERERTFLQDADEKYPSVAVFSYSLEEDLQLTIRKDLHLDVAEEKAKHSQGHYHAIVGCFSSGENAQNLINDLQNKGLNAYQVDVKGGLHRVSAGNGSSTQEINALRQQLNDLSISSWILKK